MGLFRLNWPTNLGIILSTVLVTPWTAMAEKGEQKPSWSMDAMSVGAGQSLAPFSLDNIGTANDQNSWLSHRLRLHGSYRLSKAIKLSIGLEALSGRVAGDDTQVGQAVGDDTFIIPRHRKFGVAEAMLRELNLTIKTPIGVFQLGHRPIHWGTGFLVNDGQHPALFGTAKRGNLVERLLFATRPRTGLDVYISIDGVFKDENADFLRGDVAVGATAGIKVGGKKLRMGLFQSYRLQSDRLDTRHPTGQETELEAFTSNLYLKSVMQLRPSLRLESEMEFALVFGHTDRPYLDETYETGADIFAGGGIVQLKLIAAEALTIGLNLGYASGDNDPRDDVVRTFSFHSDYRVGLVLFDHVLPLTTARSADRLLLANLADRQPSGLRFTVAQGGVRGATYINPTLQHKPVKEMDVRLGYLFALSNGEAADLYQSAIAGGYNTGINGKAQPGRILGHEVDLAIHLRLGQRTQNRSRTTNTQFTVGAEVGIFVPGNSFDGTLGGTVRMGRVFAGMNWGGKGS